MRGCQILVGMSLGYRIKVKADDSSRQDEANRLRAEVQTPSDGNPPTTASEITEAVVKVYSKRRLAITYTIEIYTDEAREIFGVVTPAAWGEGID